MRDSSLSASIQAIVAAEVGHLDLAYEYFRETAFIDLRDLAGNTADGLHLASLAGAWLVAVAGFGGMRDHGDDPRFRPAPARAADPAVLPAAVPRPPPPRSRSARTTLATSCSPASRSSCSTTASRSPWRPASPQTRACPALPEPPPVEPPPGRRCPASVARAPTLPALG